ncbi:MAG: hypothetical protein ACOY4O_19030 [Pseudomonadota bacterium]|jgi:hypothetical protein
MRTSLLIAGILCLITGSIWLGQGTGYFPYPASSFMVGESNWAIYGGLLALFGLLLAGVSRRS